jgi:hypothetical protein
VSPFSHPLDQFRRDHPFLAQQGQDVGLEQAPQDAGIEDGGVDETAVRPEGPRGSQDMQVWMPIQKLPGCLDPLEPVFVFPGEAVEILVKDSVEGGPLGPPGAVKFRFIDS